MTEIHAFDPDGTPSPGAQTALDEAVTGLATTADVTAQIGAATEGLASEGFVTDTVAAIPTADTATPGLITLGEVSARASDTVQAAMSQAVTSDELFTSVVLGASPTITTLMIAPYPLRITTITMVFDSFTLAANATNYMTATFRKYTTTGTVLVSKATSTEGITARKPWRFDAVSWNESARELAEGDALNLGFGSAGTGSTVTFPVNITIGYEPL